MTSRRKYALGLAVLAVPALTAASCDQKGLGDAPVGDRLEDERTVIVMPDEFPNLTVVCDGTTRLYVTTRQAPPVAIADHPACRGEEFINEEPG